MTTKLVRQQTVITNAFHRNLIDWFRQHRRLLPWRNKRTPYRVWIAEIMLQQTRVDQAQPYFDRFMKRFPSLRSLAAAPREDVLKCWEGLGYYSRARNLHEAARHIARDHKGRFPRTREELLALPGIGPYTAAAIGSLAFQLPLAVVDGNVIRVLSRVFAIEEPASSSKTTRQVQEWADRLLLQEDPGTFNEAMMELGALCCTPRGPDCPNCPLRAICQAHKKGQAEAYPRKAPRKKIPHKLVAAGVIINSRNQILLAQRRDTDMLGGLWEFPGGKMEPGEDAVACLERELKEELGIRVRVGDELLVVAHAFSHFTMDLHAHWVKIISGRPRAIECADYVWTPPAQLRMYPMPRADVKIAEHVMARFADGTAT
ncbi:MAG: A/G-specific adenine glycosylase [Spartobacteria bacterium]|nr:A/G-specific adenine glycosylase [Spartobacteria bacterium]